MDKAQTDSGGRSHILKSTCRAGDAAGLFIQCEEGQMTSGHLWFCSCDDDDVIVNIIIIHKKNNNNDKNDSDNNDVNNKNDNDDNINDKQNYYK